ncbi:unnamed protein product [Parnassius mnemosyne]|uniref:Uncharacterized protein n=1 Tax=Parnassius mnemosyne TaxID=213953 RepID=A0AAV1LH55_9NEOP
MSQSWRVVSLGSSVAVALPLLLLLSASSGNANPIFGLLDALNPTDAFNGTSLLGALALAHIEHSVDKLNAFAQLVELFANASETAILGG